jgi:hypothetical protein
MAIKSDLADIVEILLQHDADV